MDGTGYIFREGVIADPAAPRLFLFHGTGGDENQFFDIGGRVAPGAHLIAVRGDVNEQGALRYFKRTGEGAYDMADLDRATAKLAGFVRSHRGVAESRKVLGLGYSNGANMLASVLFAAPGLFDAAVLMHPLIPFTPPLAPGLSGKRVLITAGRRDPIAPAARTEALAHYFETQGAITETAWRAGGHEVDAAEFEAARAFLAWD